MNTTTHAHDSVTLVTASRWRRADAGAVWLSQRDLDGLLLCGEHWGAPSDLLATALRVEPERLPARWRRAGCAATGRLAPGPRWCWLTRDGIYLTSPAARLVVTRVAASLPPAEQARVVVRDLPGYAFAPEQLR